MAAHFGKGRLRRRRADEDDATTSISDEASLWWTRGDFVQHAVIRTSSHAHAGASSADDARRASADDVDDRPFSELFTTASLYGPPHAAARPHAAAAPHAAPPHGAAAGPRVASAAPVPPTPERPSPPRAKLAPNHPLASALHCLGLDDEATWPDVQQAYRARAKEAHPDRTGDDGGAMAELNATYASLRNGWRYGLFDDD